MRCVFNRGFSLIEINLAIFLIAMGMLTLFSLFPTGLKQIESAADDTQEAFFADYVLNTLRSNAALVPPDNWGNLSQFTSDILQYDLPGITSGSSIQSIPFPVADSYMRFVLEISDGGNGIRVAKLWCRSGQYGAENLTTFKSGASLFMTSFFYSGMP